LVGLGRSKHGKRKRQKDNGGSHSAILAPADF
jgi:hypothetical protein